MTQPNGRDGFPPVLPQLVEELARRFPDECPDLKLPDREVWFKAGQVSIVRFLRSMSEKQVKQTIIRST